MVLSFVYFHLTFPRRFHAIPEVSPKDRLDSPPNMQGPKVGDCFRLPAYVANVMKVFTIFLWL